MRGRLLKILRTLIALVLLVGVGLGVYELVGLIGKFASLLRSLDKEVLTAIIATSGTIFAAVGTVVYSQRRTKEREIQEAHRPQKIKVYQEFMDKAIVRALSSAKENKDNPKEQKRMQKELEAFMLSFTADLIVWGSPQVILTFDQFRELERPENPEQDPKILLRVDDILRAIRKDLGNSNRGIAQGKLVSLFLKNPDELYRLIRM